MWLSQSWKYQVLVLAAEAPRLHRLEDGGDAGVLLVHTWYHRDRRFVFNVEVELCFVFVILIWSCIIRMLLVLVNSWYHRDCCFVFHFNTISDIELYHTSVTLDIIETWDLRYLAMFNIMIRVLLMNSWYHWTTVGRSSPSYCCSKGRINSQKIKFCFLLQDLDLHWPLSCWYYQWVRSRSEFNKEKTAKKYIFI